ncbi:glycosyltransferase [Roseomonas sp. PWR1]|uniref:Glycosyltransferase n=1 Tax=Roseomonas nitratireducens TaxID=2820810 RepID=A0ABS4APS0_9PROT|nr:glycosyltransferase [Neoroseomonas nitratireducens]MBP0462567.1 glycosyltransferase [Neoroseomonas nitratireducens]
MVSYTDLLEQILDAFPPRSVAVFLPFAVGEREASAILEQGIATSVTINLENGCLPTWSRDGFHDDIFSLKRLPASALFLDHQLRLPVAWYARLVRRGVRRLHIIGPDGRAKGVNAIGYLRRKAVRRAVRTYLRAHGRASDHLYQRVFSEIIKRLSFLAIERSAFMQDRVVLAIGTLGPGGAERQVKYTAIGLQRSGTFVPTVLCQQSLDAHVSNFFGPQLTAAGVEVRTARGDPALTDDWRVQSLKQDMRERYDYLGVEILLEQILALVSELRRVRPAILHSWLDATNSISAVAARIVGVPHLLLGGRSMAPDNFALLTPHMRAAYRTALADPDTSLLNNSSAGADDYARWLSVPRQRIQVIPNGFEFPDPPTEADLARARSAAGIPHGAFVIGGLQRFSEEKRPELWVAAAMDIVRREKRAVALCYGAGPMHAELKAMVEKAGLADRIFLPGLTGDAWEALRCFDVFLLTSRQEGLPNVLIEAQAMGVPVVAPPVGGVPETLEDGVTGILVPKADAASLAAAILSLASDPARHAAMARAASRHVRNSFGMDVMLQRTLAAYARQPVWPMAVERIPHD